MIRKRIVFYGQVQGVGFRYNAYYLAQTRPLTGWVRNEYDGSVTMEIQGTPQEINSFIHALQESRFVRVEDMASRTISLEEDERNFKIVH